MFLVVTCPACGAGNGTSTNIPPGQPTTAPPSDNVLYVSLSDGDQVVAYRLGTDGFLPSDPFDSVPVDNPREILLHDGVLFAVLEDRVVSFTLGPDGSLPPAVSSQTTPINDAEGTDLLILDDILYVTFADIGVVQTYPIIRGQLTLDALSSSGTSTSDYVSMTENDGYLYIGAVSGVIDTYVIQTNGSLLEDPEDQDPETEVTRPEDMLVANGILYSISQSKERIQSYTIQPNGLLPEKFETRTGSHDRYARLVLDGNRLYASGFSKGRIDMYVLEPDGSLPRKPTARTKADAATAPVGLILKDGILYVAQAGANRVDAYVLGVDGSPSEFPTSSTGTIEGGEPLGLAMGSFPP